MRKNQLLSLILILVLFTFLLGGCAAPSTVQNDSTADSAEFTPVTVIDMMNREITITAPVERVVALTAGDCEIIYALGAEDLLVGRGEYCDYPVEVSNIPSVQSGYETNIEQIIALKPQLLLMSSMDQPEEQVAHLESAGIQVAVSDADDIAGTYYAIEMIGKLLNKDAEATALVDQMKSSFEQLQADSSTFAGKTIYFEVSPLEYGLWTAGQNTFMNEVAEILGLKNCFADVEGWAEISEEQVLERNPDYIMTITMFFGEGPTPEEEILSRPGWNNVAAVKNNAILCLPNNELSRPAPRLTEGAQALYDFVSASLEQNT